MSEDAAPERIAVTWSPEARADLRAIDRETALQILHCVDRYLANRNGDVKMRVHLLMPTRTAAVRSSFRRVQIGQRPTKAHEAPSNP